MTVTLPGHYCCLQNTVKEEVQAPAQSVAKMKGLFLKCDFNIKYLMKEKVEILSFPGSFMSPCISFSVTVSVKIFT